MIFFRLKIKSKLKLLILHGNIRGRLTVQYIHFITIKYSYKSRLYFKDF